MNEVTHNLLKLPDIQEGEVVIAKSFYTADLAVGRRVVHNTASQFLPFLHDRNVMLPFIFLEVFQFLNIKILNQKKKKKQKSFYTNPDKLFMTSRCSLHNLKFASGY